MGYLHPPLGIFEDYEESDACVLNSYLLQLDTTNDPVDCN
jgi:hypothetical protein